MSILSGFLPARRPVASELVAVVEASIPEAKRLQKKLEAAGIPVVLGGQECCSSGGCAPKAAITVPREAIPQVRAVLQDEWESNLQREKHCDPELLAKVKAAQETPSDHPACPACGHVGPLDGSACGDCGLFLG